MADRGGSHGHDLKTELRDVEKEKEHEHNVKEKHVGIRCCDP